MKILFGDSTYNLTVGSFADETHRVSFFLEDEEQDFVFECTKTIPIEKLEKLEIDEIAPKTTQMYRLFLKEGLVHKKDSFDTADYIVCRLTQKAQDFLKEYEAQN